MMGLVYGIKGVPGPRGEDAPNGLTEDDVKRIINEQFGLDGAYCAPYKKNKEE